MGGGGYYPPPPIVENIIFSLEGNMFYFMLNYCFKEGPTTFILNLIRLRLRLHFIDPIGMTPSGKFKFQLRIHDCKIIKKVKKKL